jgi:hypothetical protein
MVVGLGEGRGVECRVPCCWCCRLGACWMDSGCRRQGGDEEGQGGEGGATLGLRLAAGAVPWDTGGRAGLLGGREREGRRRWSQRGWLVASSFSVVGRSEPGWQAVPSFLVCPSFVLFRRRFCFCFFPPIPPLPYPGLALDF